MGTAAFVARMGAEPKQKLRKRACKIFAFFCQSQLAGIIRAHPSHPWLVLFQPHPARGLLKTSSFAWIRVDSRACVFHGRDGRAPLLFLRASAALRENLGTMWAGTLLGVVLN